MSRPSTPGGVMRTLEEIQANLRAPDHISAVRARLQVQRERYEKLKYKHSHSSPGIFHELRHQFQSSLNKLNDLNTREVGVREAKRIIDRNVSEGALKVYLSCLGEVSKMKSPGAREQDVLLIGHIAHVYREKLIEEDPAFKILGKIFDIVQEFFKDGNRQVHEAAAKAWAEVYTYVLPKDNPDLFFGHIYDPLEIALMSGINVKAQQASAIAIFYLVKTLYEAGETEMLKHILLRVLALFLKQRADYPDLISTLGLLIENQGLLPIYSDLYNLINKLTQYLKYTGSQSHLYKIEACKLLECLARLLQNTAELVLEPFSSEILDNLYALRTDKLPAVQHAAKQAYNQWKELSILQKELEEQKMEKEQVPAEEIVQFRTSYPAQDFKKRRTVIKDTHWGLEKPKFLEKHSGQYGGVRESVQSSPIRMHSPLRKPEGVDSNIMEIINQPRKREIESTFEEMQRMMDQNFKAINESLNTIDNRIEEAHSRVDLAESHSERKTAYIHPPQVPITPHFREITPTQKPIIKRQSPFEMDDLSKQWTKTLEDLQNGDIQDAYQRILNSKDDIYLIRLMHKTGPCLAQLDENTARTVMQRLGLILDSDFVNCMGVDWLSEAVNNNVLDSLDKEARLVLKRAMIKVSSGEEEQAPIASQLSMFL